MKDKCKREISPEFRAIKRQYASCFVTLYASFLIGLLVRTILNWPIAAILSDNTMLGNNIMSLIDGIIGTSIASITLFILSFFDGYYHNKFVFKQMLLALVLTFATQTVLAILLGHSVWFSGPGVFLSTYTFKTIHFDAIGQMGAKRIIANYDWLFTTLTFWIFYAPLMVLGKYLGAKKSKKNFAKDREEKEREKTLDGHPFD